MSISSEAGLRPLTRLDLYRDMLRNRRIEEEIARRYADQQMRCPVHLSIGQEAIATGVCLPLGPHDQIVSTHRAHAHYLSKGGDLTRMIAELHGRETGCCGGRGGSMHLFDPEAGVLLSSPIVASGIPVATGAALAMQMEGSASIAVSFLGDGSIEEGAFHEAANFAALRRLPIIYVCENNLFSCYTNIVDRQPAGLPLTRFGAAHGLPCRTEDGNDAEAVLDAMEEATARARSGGGPSFLVFNTYRWLEHCGPNNDDALGYRPPGEPESWRARDPLARLRARLLAAGEMTDRDEQGFETAIAVEIARAFEAALAAPFPDASNIVPYA